MALIRKNSNLGFAGSIAQPHEMRYSLIGYYLRFAIHELA